ncbi:hypothetical protein [Chryseobacterium fistulae]|uniref:Uncharacterized protein n=1 Tax=Chryseobacterium fistulae TaxID=2675058 RepID=A0A6N4XS13_9FLAO|nr:hypothetical protein [Chryseobacterium fistulae]CAA7391685.1 hypothetical protein CHRY9393_02956 [Chryseobacterium fistulae]
MIFPEFFVEHVDITKAETEQTELYIYFDEKAIVPKEDSDRLLESKGFVPEITRATILYGKKL